VGFCMQKRPVTLACVTDQMNCERIIRAARRLADVDGSSLCVINVSDPDLSKQDSRSIEYLFSVSKKHDAVMNVFYSDNPYKVLSNFIKENRVVTVVTGMPRGENSILSKLTSRFIATDFFAVDQNGTATQLFDGSAKTTIA